MKGQRESSVHSAISWGQDLFTLFLLYILISLELQYGTPAMGKLHLEKLLNELLIIC